MLIGSAPGVVTASLNNAWAPIVYRTDPAHRGEVLERTSRDIAALAALAAGVRGASSRRRCCGSSRPRSYDPTQLTPAVGIVAIGTVLSVLYLANVHLVFASGRSTGLALVTPRRPARRGRCRLGAGARRSASTAISVGHDRHLRRRWLPGSPSWPAG